MFIKLWMQERVRTIESDTPIGQAKDILDQADFRHLPVMQENKLIGILSQTDINRALPSAADSSLSPENVLIATQAHVSAFMSQNPITTTPMAPLEDVALLMRRFKVGAIPVLEEEELVGIITETDIFQAFIEMSGVGDPGARIELCIASNGTALYAVTDICKKFNMRLNAMSIYKNFSEEQQLITIRVNGEDLDALVNALWDSGAKVNRVIRSETEDD